jgi:hypothetical protein
MTTRIPGVLEDSHAFTVAGGTGDPFEWSIDADSHVLFGGCQLS